MSHFIHHEDSSTFGFEKGMYFYVDSDQKMDKKVVGVFTDTYDMDTSDLAGKKFKFLTNRDKLSGVRYLHAVKKDKKDAVKEVCDKFKIKIPTFQKVEDRKMVYQDDKTSITEYNPGVSYAIFTTFDKLESHLRENKIMRNVGLTSPDGSVRPGFVLGARKANKDNYLEELVKLAKEGGNTYEGNEIQQEAESSKGNKVFSIWGETDHLIDSLLKIQGDDKKLNTLEAKALQDGRVYYKVEVIEED